MKKHIFGFTAGVATLLVAACSNIDVEDRFIPVEAPEVACRVLLFDFTGQRCTNCPAAHKVLEKLDRLYGEDLITVAIHAGSFGIPDGGPTATRIGLKQPEGDELAEHWKIDAYPSGIINGAGPFESDKWATEVAEAITRETCVELYATAIVTDEGNVLANYSVLSSEKWDGKVAAWLTEDSIVAQQIDNGTSIPNYTHNHVFRCSLGELYGKNVNLGAREEKFFEQTALTSEHPHWNTNKMNIVVFAMDRTGNIVQSCQVPVELPSPKE